MYNWKRNRNYRKYKQPDGSTKYTITIDGIVYEVAKAVFYAYSKADRKERYFYENQPDNEISLERLIAKNVPLIIIFKDRFESAEDSYIEHVSSRRLADAINQLDPDEQMLIQEHFFKGVSLRSLSKKCGVPKTTICRRRDKILAKMKKWLE